MDTSTVIYRRFWLLVGCLILLTVVAFWPVWQNDFAHYFDGDEYVLKNHVVQKGLTWQGLHWAFTTFHASNWHPLTWLSHMLDCQLSRWLGGHADGLNPDIHHFTNLLLHGLNAVLLFRVLCVMGGVWPERNSSNGPFIRGEDRSGAARPGSVAGSGRGTVTERLGAGEVLWASAFVAAVFAVHPLRVESVAWVAERKDVLSAFFWMLTLWAYVAYVRQRSWWRYLGVVVFLGLGLLAKPMLVTLPFVLLLLDVWPLMRVGRWRIPGDRSRDGQDASTGERADREGQRGGAGKPAGKRKQSSGKKSRSRAAEAGAGAAGVDVVVLVGRGESVRRLIVEKLPLFVLVVFSCLMTVKAQSSKGAVASLDIFDAGGRVSNAVVSYARYLGMLVWPSGLAAFYPHPRTQSVVLVFIAGVVLAGITVMAVVWRRRRPWWLIGWLWYLGTLVPVIGLMQVGQQSHADRYTYLPLIGVTWMVAWTLAEWSRRWRCRRGPLAVAAAVVLALLAVGTWRQLPHWRSGKALFQRAVAVTANNHLAYNNLGNIFLDEGNAAREQGDEASAMAAYNQAVDCYRQALAILPGYTEACNNLGITLSKMGQVDEAIRYCRESLKMDPDYAQGHYNLAYILAEAGQVDEAVTHYRRAIELKRDDYFAAEYNLAKLLDRLGRLPEAKAHFDKALTMAPDHSGVRNSLGNVLAKMKQYPAAEAQYQAIIELFPENGDAWFNWGRVLWEQDRLDEAVAKYQRVLELNPGDADVYCILGDIHLQQGRVVEAGDYYERCLAIRPGHPGAVRGLRALVESDHPQ